MYNKYEFTHHLAKHKPVSPKQLNFCNKHSSEHTLFIFTDLIKIYFLAVAFLLIYKKGLILLSIQFLCITCPTTKSVVKRTSRFDLSFQIRKNLYQHMVLHPV